MGLISSLQERWIIVDYLARLNSDSSYLRKMPIIWLPMSNHKAAQDRTADEDTGVVL